MFGSFLKLFLNTCLFRKKIIEMCQKMCTEETYSFSFLVLSHFFSNFLIRKRIIFYLKKNHFLAHQYLVFFCLRPKNMNLLEAHPVNWKLKKTNSGEFSRQENTRRVFESYYNTNRGRGVVPDENIMKVGRKEKQTNERISRKRI